MSYPNSTPFSPNVNSAHPTPSYGWCIRAIERAYDDLSDPAALAAVKRDYETLRNADTLPYIMSARDMIRRTLEAAEAEPQPETDGPSW